MKLWSVRILASLFSHFSWLAGSSKFGFMVFSTIVLLALSSSTVASATNPSMEIGNPSKEIGNASKEIASASKKIAIPSGKAKAKAKAYQGIVADIQTACGIYKLKACPQGIRIEGHVGHVFVAQAPDWTVYVFRPGQKKAARLSYSVFETKNRSFAKLSDIHVPPRKEKIAGVDAVTYTFAVNQRADGSSIMGSVYRSSSKLPLILCKDLSFSANTFSLPLQVRELWRTYFESPVANTIPLQSVFHFEQGETRRIVTTKSIRPILLASTDFEVPKGLSFTAQFAEMTFGNEVEGVADLLSDP